MAEDKNVIYIIHDHAYSDCIKCGKRYNISIYKEIPETGYECHKCRDATLMGGSHCKSMRRCQNV